MDSARAIARSAAGSSLSSANACLAAAAPCCSSRAAARSGSPRSAAGSRAARSLCADACSKSANARSASRGARPGMARAASVKSFVASWRLSLSSRRSSSRPTRIFSPSSRARSRWCSTIPTALAAARIPSSKSQRARVARSGSTIIPASARCTVPRGSSVVVGASLSGAICAIGSTTTGTSGAAGGPAAGEAGSASGPGSPPAFSPSATASNTAWQRPHWTLNRVPSAAIPSCTENTARQRLHSISTVSSGRYPFCRARRPYARRGRPARRTSRRSGRRS